MYNNVATICNLRNLKDLVFFYRTDLYGIRGNTKLKCYPNCVRNIPNKGYADAYGNLKKCNVVPPG